jgi:uncharacterized protein (DUF2461 family)
MGGGLYIPGPEELKKVRQEIDYNLADFKKIIGAKKFTTIYKSLDNSPDFLLSRVPKGYDPANPAAEFLKLKSFIAMTPVSDADLQSGQLVRKTLTAFSALLPLIDFMNTAVGD